MARRTVLTEELISEICNLIRAGAYDFIACERNGISQSTFYSWIRQAEVEGADPLLVQFLQSVEEAKATARCIAEIKVLKEQPATWLLKGPGRERPNRPGWSNENVVTLQAGNKPILLTWDDDDTNPITEAPRITEVSEG